MWDSLFSLHKITKNPLIQVFFFGMAKIHGAMGAWHLLAIKESAASIYVVFSYCSISRLNNLPSLLRGKIPGVENSRWRIALGFSWLFSFESSLV